MAGSPNRQTAPRGLAAAVHIAVFHPPPLMGVPLLGHDFARVIDLGRTQKFGNVQRQRQKVYRHIELVFELKSFRLGKVGVRALIIKIMGDGGDRHTGTPVFSVAART